MKRVVKRVIATLLTLVLVISGVNIPKVTARAATEIDLSPYITMSGTTAGAVDNGQGLGIMITEILFSMPSHLDSKDEWAANNVNSLIIDISITEFLGADGKNPGVMPFFMSNSWVWNRGTYGDLATSTNFQLTMDVASLDWGSSNSIGKFGLQFANLVEGSTVEYTINSVKFSSETVSSGDSGNSGNSGSVNIPSGNLTDYNYDDIDYNYAKLLQYSLYFYDANMCGDEVTEKSLHSWRNDCHTYDKYNYVRSDGAVITVDLTGGFHDAGDHVKFGLPEAYAAFTLGMSYDTNKAAYVAAKQEEHLETITTHFADYLVNCAVLNPSGTSVEAFCVQVGNGGAGYDHGYWGAPENQPQNNRTAYFTSSSAPHTDIVSLSAAALAMQYKNFGGEKYLETAKMLFDYAKNNSKSVGTTAGDFYKSSNYEDDYCLAALLLYHITGDATYQTEYNNYKNYEAAMKPYWPHSWDNVGPAVAYYSGDSSKLSTLMGQTSGKDTYGGYVCMQKWGSARYNTSMQYAGLMYDKLTNTDTYRSWAEGQMKYLLGNNAAKQCFVVGYNDYGPRYPHHRAASGYDGGDKGTTAQKYVLLGALVGGQIDDGTYTDSASDYVCNEVAIDYNATLVAAAAALYEDYTADTTNQYVDTNYHVDSTDSSGGETEIGETVNLAIEGTFNYEQAYEILDLVNQERAKAGKSALTMDKDLLDAAMQRSAEIAIYFEHERPNGESCYTACAKMNGENAAIDYSATSVMNGWMDSTGHKENILNGGYKSVGIGVFENGGRTYYIQCFSNGAATTTTQPANEDATATVEVLTSRLGKTTLNFRYSSYSVKAGNTVKPEIFMTNTSDLAPSFTSALAPSNFNYSFNPTGFATIDNGVITPTANGQTTLTAKLKVLDSKKATTTIKTSGFVNSVSLNKTTLELDTNGTKSSTLVATIDPTTATDKTVSWKSSNTSVATVSTLGVVTAVAPGTATITVTTNSGSKTATCEVTVWETQTAPSAPTGTSTTNSIVLDAMYGCEYSMDKTTWTTNTTFSGLTPNTEYTFYARKAANGYYKVSPASEGVVIKTLPISVTGITLSANNLKVDVGETAKLTATVEPNNATNKSYTWKSDDSTIATVDTSGNVKGIKPGSTTVTVTTNDGAKTASCIVEVYGPYDAPVAPQLGAYGPYSINLVQKSGYLYRIEGGEWTSSHEFKNLKPNTEYTFYQKQAASGYYYESPSSVGAKFKTQPVDADSVTLDKTELSFEIGGENEITTATLTATVSPSDSTYKNITWITSNNKVATVDSNGKVTAVGPGEATITAKVNDGTKKPSATCTVTVWKTPEVPTQSPSTSATPTKDTVTLTAYENCEYRVYKDGAWSEWQDSNVFTGLEPETEYTFEIRVKGDAANNINPGEAASIKVTTASEGVEIVEVTGVAFDDKLSESCTITIGENDSWSFTATVTPENATDKTITYISSNTNVATIDENGKVIAIAPGETELKVTTKIGGYEDTIKLTVKKKYDKPSAPTLASKTTTTVTLNKVTGCQYSKDGVNWQNSNVFTGLTPNTQYTFYVKKIANGYWLESDKSAGLVVKTDKETTGGDSGSTGGSEVFEAPDIKVSYRTHIQTFGWEGKEDDIKTWKSNGTMSGTSGKAKRLEGINIVVEPTTDCPDLDLGIQYTTHCQSYGWLPWSADGDMNGTEGEAKRLEAIMIQLTGKHADYYDVYYRVHAQSYGWLGWAKNGEPAGTAGYGKRLEGIQIVVVKKGESFNKAMEGITSRTDKSFEAKAGNSPIVNYQPTSNTAPVVPGEDMVNVAYRTHVQSFGWQGWKYNGQMSGTSGLAKRLEGIEINLTNKDYDGGIAYCTHVQTYAWQGADLEDPTTWKQDGQMAGTSGEAKRLEAICITLTGEMADHYDIYYRVHAQSYGWLGWAKNGDPAGTAGYAKRLEGIQIVVVPKGQAAPANTYMGVTSVKDQAYVQK